MKQRYRFLTILIACSIVMANTSHAADHLRVVTEVWEPYNYIHNGRVTGLSTEIVRKTLKAADITIAGGQILVAPWPRAYKMALEQKNVLIYTILRTPRRDSLFKWVGPLVPPEKFYLFKHHRRTDIKVRNLNDATAYRIGIIRDTHHKDALTSKGFPPSAIHTVDRQSLNVKKLLAYRIDFLIDTQESLARVTRQMNLSMDEFEKVLFFTENDYYIAFSKLTDDAIVKHFREAFLQLQQEGAFTPIREKYQAGDR